MMKRLMDVRVGDVAIDRRPLLVRIPRTARYQQTGTETVRGTVVEAASRDNRFTVAVEFADGRFSRNGQYLEIEQD